MVNPTLLRSAVTFHARHPWQAGLAVLAVALGVAMVVAVDLANESARRAFRLSAEAVTGRATHRLTAPPGGIAEGIYAELRLRQGYRRSAPLVEGEVSFRGEQFKLIGIDPLAEGAFREWRQAGTTGDGMSRLLSEPDAVVMPGIAANRLNVRVDDRLDLRVGGRRATVTVAGLIETENPQAIEGVLLADIATAQELLGREGRIDRIDLILTDREVQRLETELPPGLILEPGAAGTRNTLNMTRAFHTNLSAMSLLSVLVGGFLIYNMMTFTVLRRRATLGIQRMLGVTRGEIFVLVLIETLVLGLLGSLSGLVLGWLLGHALLGMVARTINDIYFAVNVATLSFEPGLLLKGIAVGAGAALLAGLGPAAESARASPLEVRRRSSLERRGHRWVPWLALTGVLICVAGYAILWLTTRDLWLGFVSLFLVVIGCALMVPLAVLVMLRVVTPALGRLSGVTGRFAGRGVSTGLSRTGLAIAALTVATAATVGVGIMIESFRHSVSAWLHQTLRNDIYVSVDGPGSRALLDDRIEGLVREIPDIESVSTARVVPVPSTVGEIDVLVLGAAEHSRDGYRLLTGDIEVVWPRFEAGEVVLVSEPLASRHGIRSGDRIELLSVASGPLKVIAGGIFRDYSSSQGLLVMSRVLYERHWDDTGVATVGIKLKPDADSDEVVRRIRGVSSRIGQDLTVSRVAAIREASLRIFDRTFAVTEVLRWLTIGVALIGFLSALLALQIEQAREHALLRATGLTRSGLFALVVTQTGVMGAMAGVLALPLGWLMSVLLIHVINQRAFGWSMETTVPPGVMVEALALSLVAALIAGILPALRMSRISPAMALREE